MLDSIFQYLDLMGEKVILFKQYNLQLIKITGMKINQAVHKTSVTWWNIKAQESGISPY